MEERHGFHYGLSGDRGIPMRSGADRLVPSLVTNSRKGSVKGVPAPCPIASAHKHIRHSMGSQGRVLKSTLKRPIP